MASQTKVQSRRFECAYENQSVDCSYIPNLLKCDVNVSFVQWTKDTVYIETKARKTVSYFISRYPAYLSLIRCCKSSSITQESVLGMHGSPLDTRQIRCENKNSNSPEKLRMLFKHIRETNEVPDLSEDIDAILNKGDYDKVITAAKRKNTVQQYNLQLRLWQKEVLKELNDQHPRKVLWVFDFDGNSGKTELSKYLRYKCNYQKLPPGSSHHASGVIEDEASGYIFDFTRTSTNVYDTYGLIEDIKNKSVDSFKYNGSQKNLRSNVVVVFSNFLPNMSALSLDRWSFFHTRLGFLCFDCKQVKDREYACLLNDENICSVKSPKLKFLSEKSDNDLILEYLDIEVNVKKSLSFIHENIIAFPLITFEHRFHIKRLIGENNIFGLKSYVKTHNCFKGGILTNNFIRETPLFHVNTNSNESSEESEDSNAE